MKATAEPAAGVELRPLEVTVKIGAAEFIELPFYICECGEEMEVDECDFEGVGRMDVTIEALRRAGIDIGRPFVLHLDEISGLATARQNPWTGQEEG